MAKTAVKDDETPPVDNTAETEEFRSGQVSEGELDLARSVARRMGWTPKEEWKRDPAKWVDAPDFLENTPKELEAVKERLRRNAQATESLLEDEKRRAREQALAELRTAERAGETDRAEAAAARLKAAEGPPPQVTNWIARNAWFNEDPVARAAAVAVTDSLKDRPVSEQLEAAEAEVRRRYPEHFGTVQREEVRLSEVRKPPPVQSGSRGASSAPKERGFADIPPGDRATFTQKLLKHFKSRGLTEAQAQDKYAASYWKDQA